MKRITLSLVFIIVCVTNMLAQTHADATSQKWKGIDVNTILNDPAYEDNNTFENAYQFILYNVGTGRFVVQGGDWAMEGRLFYPDFGRTMYLYNNGRINSGLTEDNRDTEKNCFCCRPPEPFGRDWSDDNCNNINLTTLMDGQIQSRYNMQWTFQRVEDESNTESYTYYMWQTWVPASSSAGQKYIREDGKIKFYLGAAWGEYHNKTVGKGDDIFVFMDDDRCCWTNATVIGNTEKKKLENGDEIEIQKLYQWKLISIKEFIDVLTQNEVGLNPSISSLIPDRDFTRNSDDFYGNWIVSESADHEYNTSNGKRYTYTWANYKKTVNQQSTTYDPRLREEAWDSPVKLKVVFDKKVSSTNTNDLPAGKKNAKYGFLPFEGIGTVYTHFEAPKPGWYQIGCTGFSMGHDAFMFARVINNNDTTTMEKDMERPSSDVPHYGFVTLEKLPDGTTYSKNYYNACLEAGKELLQNADAHKQKVWVLVSQDDWNNNRRTIRVGFGKDEATKSAIVGGGFYDTDWVCVDDLRAMYMGLSPVFFYEDQEDLTYLSHNEDDRENFSKNEYIPATLDGRYGGAASLQRSFAKDKWNTFSFLLPLTGEQVRNAFGDESKLLKLHSIGGWSHNDCIIDFETVDLLTTENVINPGVLYLLKPTKEPSHGENPRGEMSEYYDLGKMFFSTNAVDASDPEYTYPVIDLSTVKANVAASSYQDLNDGRAWVSYIRTPGYDGFNSSRVNGIYNGTTAPEGTYAPKGGYVMSDGTMYELNKDTRIKGFRAWITLTHSIFDGSSSGAPRISINGVIEGEGGATGISEAAAVRQALFPESSIVYDLSGRRVSDSLENLPKGLYIVGGKKIVVR